MKDNSWDSSTSSQSVIYQLPASSNLDQLYSIIQSLKATGIQQTQMNLHFKTQRDLKKFEEIYEQQLNQEEDYSYNHDDLPQKQQNKFKKCKEFKNNQYEVRQLTFPSILFLKIFMKTYETELRQLQIQYSYKIQITKGKFLVYFPKNESIGSFFKNQIFEMKNKLKLYYCENLNIINKIKYSKHFQNLIQKNSISAEIILRRDSVFVAVFYSSVHSRQIIIQIIKKNLLQNMTILSLYDKRLYFKLVTSLLLERVKRIQRQNQIMIELNYEKACYLIHDRHECFVDAQNAIKQAIKKLIFFRIDGKNTRTLYNKVIRNHQSYPYIRLQYSHRSLFYVLDYESFNGQNQKQYQKHLISFLQLFKEYFQNVDQNASLTFYTKFLNYPVCLIEKLNEMMEGKDLTIINYHEEMMKDSHDKSKIILGIKSLGQLSAAKVRMQFFEIFLNVVLKTSTAKHLLKSLSLKMNDYNGILGFQSDILSNFSQSTVDEKGQQKEYDGPYRKITQIKYQSSIQNQSEEIQIEQEEIQDEQKQKNKFSNEQQKNQIKKIVPKPKEKKQKNIELNYPYKKPLIDPNLSRFWQYSTRQQKLQKELQKRYPETCGRLKFKTFNLNLKQEIPLCKEGEVKQLESQKVFISTTIQKNGQLYHHFIDINEFYKISKQAKDKTFFLFYKAQGQQIYLPGYMLMLI